jgi:hypothetical protein
MAVKDRYFPTQEAGEKIFFLIRRHWIVFVTLAFFIFVMTLPLFALGVYWIISPEVFFGELGNFVIIFASIYALIIVGLCLYGFVNYYLDVYIITNERLVDIKQNGFFRREIAELHLRQVQDVEARVEGFLGTMMHFGNVYIQTAGERENFKLEDVPHPYTISKRIAELHQKQLNTPYSSAKNKSQGNEDKKLISETDDYNADDYEPYVSGRVDQKENEDKTSREPESDKISNRNIISSVEEVPTRNDCQKKEETAFEKPIKEIGFGSNDKDEEQEKKISQELKEFFEGEEVKLDEHD